MVTRKVCIGADNGKPLRRWLVLQWKREMDKYMSGNVKIHLKKIIPARNMKRKIYSLSECQISLICETRSLLNSKIETCFVKNKGCRHLVMVTQGRMCTVPVIKQSSASRHELNQWLHTEQFFRNFVICFLFCSVIRVKKLIKTKLPRRPRRVFFFFHKCHLYVC